MKEPKDEALWQQAKARADFKTHFATYFLINAMLWVVWLAIGGIDSYPWPIWPTAGWGVGVILNYLAVYKFNNSAEKEYEKLEKHHVQ